MDRTEIERRVQSLRTDLGAAQIDGKKIGSISAAIAESEAQLAAIDAADSVRVARQREQEAKDAAASRKGKIRRVAELEQHRLLAWAETEKACRALVEAMGRVVSSTESERALLNDVAPPAVPAPLGSYETRSRVRGRVGELIFAANVGFEIAGAREFSRRHRCRIGARRSARR